MISMERNWVIGNLNWVVDEDRGELGKQRGKRNTTGWKGLIGEHNLGMRSGNV